MLDKWVGRGLLLIVMLFVPFGYGFGLLELMKSDLSNYRAVPALLGITYFIVLIGDINWHYSAGIELDKRR